MELILKRKEKLPTTILVGIITLPFELVFGVLLFLWQYAKWIISIKL